MVIQKCDVKPDWRRVALRGVAVNLTSGDKRLSARSRRQFTEDAWILQGGEQQRG